MTTITVENISDKARDAGSAINTAMPQSVSSAAQKTYDKIAGGAQWYFEQWEDVFEEARAMRAAAAGFEEINIGDFLPSLPEAKVESDIPGRLRVRARQLKGQTHLAQQCTETLGNLDGITEVHVSPLTGSILFYYDKKLYETADVLLQAVEQA